MSRVSIEGCSLPRVLQVRDRLWTPLGTPVTKLPAGSFQHSVFAGMTARYPGAKHWKPTLFYLVAASIGAGVALT